MRNIVLFLALLVGTATSFVCAPVPIARSSAPAAAAAARLLAHGTPPSAFTVAASAAVAVTAPRTRMNAGGTLQDMVDNEKIYGDADAIFAVLDVDGDGSVSNEELESHLSAAGYAAEAIAKVFAVLDADKNGSISRDELRAGLVRFSPLRAGPGLGAFNTDFVTEIEEDADSLFDKIDTDNDGAVTMKELRSHVKIMAKRENQEMYSFRATENIFSVIDADKDGSVSREELREAFVRCSALRMALGDGPNFK